MAGAIFEVTKEIALNKARESVVQLAAVTEPARKAPEMDAQSRKALRQLHELVTCVLGGRTGEDGLQATGGRAIEALEGMYQNAVSSKVLIHGIDSVGAGQFDYIRSAQETVASSSANGIEKGVITIPFFWFGT